MLTYRDAGVDIDAADELLRRLKPLIRSTFTPGVIADIGHFGGFFDARFSDYEHPVLVASTDGVGTKVKLAIRLGSHSTVGQDLVNHCVNDILCCGARPLFFLDYFACGRLDIGVAEQVIGGIITACRSNGCALLGGETAEMPSVYAPGDYDLAGTIIGVVEYSHILDGRSIQPGDVLIGLASTGLHTNGYSLAMAALRDHDLETYMPELGSSLGEALLAVHRSYAATLLPVLQRGLAKGIAHVTGGGIVGNLQRILPRGVVAEIMWDAWQVPPLFRYIQRAGAIPEEEMRRVFNLGIGMVLVIAPEHVSEVMALCAEESPVVIGEIRKASQVGA
ncbi:MAG: phosphoribosylformylglycinamidine cyclo-ligase [Candidatus Kapabacteria bacterium]|nr:phosphoribosylformylglycinamidine cyclo-ligase [Candidatus Kapabacteria bacterium]MDW8012547.1 phosphoribosylformylglycinamidine cyclo-ligase [Bacteroidota bacterium]